MEVGLLTAIDETTSAGPAVSAGPAGLARSACESQMQSAVVSTIYIYIYIHILSVKENGERSFHVLFGRLSITFSGMFVLCFSRHVPAGFLYVF